MEDNVTGKQSDLGPKCLQYKLHKSYIKLGGSKTATSYNMNLHLFLSNKQSAVNIFQRGVLNISTCS